jgi:hypothetical protein
MEKMDPLMVEKRTKIIKTAKRGKSHKKKYLRKIINLHKDVFRVIE